MRVLAAGVALHISMVFHLAEKSAMVHTTPTTATAHHLKHSIVWLNQTRSPNRPQSHSEQQANHDHTQKVKTGVEQTYDKSEDTRNQPIPIWQHNNPFFQRVERDAFCHGCRPGCSTNIWNGYFLEIRDRITGQVSLTHVKDEYDQEPRSVVSPFLNQSALIPSKVRARCQPCLVCPERDHWYGRPDEAAPPTVHAASHYLQSIPAKHRFPHDVSTWSVYFQDKSNGHPNRKYFLEYNPSIVRIPKHQIPHAYRNESVVYLASFRVSTMHSCDSGPSMFMAMWGLPDNNGTFPANFTLPKIQNLAGLALLREDLSIVTDSVFQFNGLGAKQSIEDIRLFILQDQLYFASFASLQAMWLVEPEVPRPWIKRVEPVFGDWSPLIVDSVPVCPSPPKRGGKNIQYFVDGGAVIAERYPMGEKVHLNVTGKCPHSILEERQVNKTLPPPSFGTVDELHFWKHGVHSNPMTRDERGSACCVPVQHNNKLHLLGVSHSKFRFSNPDERHSLPGNVSANHFFSSFYVMEATEPYSVVARSGRFCLGYSSAHEVETQNPYGRVALHKNLHLGEQQLDCPGIHYVSGMTDTPDGKHLIIAYGVADCTPRMIKVRTKDVMRTLFPYEVPRV